jgi:hypothetical protein
VGARLVVIGSPLGLSQTVSEGIVSAIRVFNGRRLLQMSAPISPGSSGGPVLNDRGAVVAVATAYLAGGQQLNFAVPIAEAVRLSTASAHAAPRPLSAVFGVAAKASGRSPSAPSTAIPGWTFVGYVHSEDVTGPQDSLMRHIRPNRDGTYVVRDEYRVDHALADGKRWRVAYSTISAGCADEYWTWRSTEYRTQQGDLVYVDAVVLTLRRTEGSTQSGTSMVATVYRYACSSR